MKSHDLYKELKTLLQRVISNEEYTNIISEQCLIMLKDMNLLKILDPRIQEKIEQTLISTGSYEKRNKYISHTSASMKDIPMLSELNDNYSQNSSQKTA